jgi:hypothetical protein
MQHYLTLINSRGSRAAMLVGKTANHFTANSPFRNTVLSNGIQVCSVMHRHMSNTADVSSSCNTSQAGDGKASMKLEAMSGQAVPGLLNDGSVDVLQEYVDDAHHDIAILQRVASIVTNLTERTVTCKVLHLGVEPVQNTENSFGSPTLRNLPYFFGSSSLYDLIGASSDAMAVEEVNRQRINSAQKVDTETADSSTIEHTADVAEELPMRKLTDREKLLLGDGNLDCDEFGKIIPRETAASIPVVATVSNNASNKGKERNESTNNHGGMYSDVVHVPASAYHTYNWPFSRNAFNVVVCLDSTFLPTTPLDYSSVGVVRSLLSYVSTHGFVLVAVPEKHWETCGILQEAQDLQLKDEANLMSIQVVSGQYLMLVRRE